jgi:hypothetical protein
MRFTPFDGNQDTPHSSHRRMSPLLSNPAANLRMVPGLLALPLLAWALTASPIGAETGATGAQQHAPTAQSAQFAVPVSVPPPAGFTAPIPLGYERIVINDPRVGLVLRPRAGGFPTITAVIEPGPFLVDEERATTARTAAVLQSYRSLGFNDLAGDTGTERRIHGHRALEWELRYRADTTPFIARVVEVTFTDRRLTFTWLAPRSVDAATHEVWSTFRDSIEFSTAEASAASVATTPLPRPGDFGPIYAETDMSRFPVEPLNTASNIVFAALLVIFARRTRLDRGRYPFLVPALGILTVGVVGGTVYHATRSHNIWLILDFLPIAILSFATSLFFWFRIVRRRLLGVLACITLLASGLLPRAYLDAPLNVEISLSYLGAALAILIPAAVHSAGPGRAERRYVFWAAIFFGIAIVCRSVDHDLARTVFPMGTHFLWHIFGGLSVGALLSYVARLEESAPPSAAQGVDVIASSPQRELTRAGS